MEIEQVILLIINIIGGAAVIGSYVLGVRGKKGSADRLWGGMPQKVRPVYYISMLLSAIGYFLFIYFLLFKVNPDSVLIADTFGYWIFYIIFIGMLGFSALWMPLTNKMANEPKQTTWIRVRTVLFLVAFFSAALYWALLSIQEGNASVIYWLAVAGSGYFTFHTAILDMLIWPILWKKKE